MGRQSLETLPAPMYNNEVGKSRVETGKKGNRIKGAKERAE